MEKLDEFRSVVNLTLQSPGVGRAGKIFRTLNPRPGTRLQSQGCNARQDQVGPHRAVGKAPAQPLRDDERESSVFKLN